MSTFALVTILGTFAFVGVLVFAAWRAGKTKANHEHDRGQLDDIDNANAARRRYASDDKYKRRMQDRFRR